jgi:hypothetical protein
MKYKNERDLLFRYIILNEPHGSILRNSIFYIQQVVDNKIYASDGTSLTDALNKIDLLEDILQDKNFNIGDEVVLNKNYNSFKKNEKIIIQGFIDNERKKIVTDKIAPGGWIDTQHVFKEEYENNLRFKSFLECCADFGIGWVNFNSKLAKRTFNYLGKNINKLLTKRKADHITIDGDLVPGIYLTTKPLHEKYDLVLISEEEWKKQMIFYNPEVFSSTEKAFKNRWGKSYKEWDLQNKFKNLTIEKLIHTINESDLRDNKENKIDSLMVKLIKLT